MKPYLIVTSDLVKTGGMDRANLALADYLAQRGHPVHLVAHRVDEELLSYPNVIYHPVPKIANSYALSSSRLNRIGQTQAQKIMKAGGRVLVNGGNCRVDDINWVHYVHAVDSLYPPSNILRRLKRQIERKYALREERQIVPKARLIFTPSERAKRDVVEQLGVSEERVHPVYYGIDSARFRPLNSEERRLTRQRLGLPLDRRLVIFVGALGNRRKGFDTLFQAWKQLCQPPEWDADLIVVGQGAEVAMWQQRSMNDGLGGRIKFLGFVSNVQPLLAVCDLFVLPSRYETYLLAAQEAICCGVPALISASTGIAERYPAELMNLLLPDPENVDDLAQRLQHWRHQIDHYRHAVIPFSERLRATPWQEMAKQMVEIIESAEELSKKTVEYV